MLAVVQPESSDVGPPFSAPMTFQSPISMGSNNSSCTPRGTLSSCSPRRVIFPSLHISELPVSPLTTSDSIKSCPVPCGGRPPISPQSSLRPLLLATKVPSSRDEREKLLSRLDALLPLPSIHTASLPSKQSNISKPFPVLQAPSLLPRPRSTPQEVKPIKSIFDLPPVTPMLKKDLSEEDPLSSLNRIIMPALDSNLPETWSLKPRLESQEPDAKPACPSPTSILRKPSLGVPGSSSKDARRRLHRSVSPACSVSSDLPSLASSNSSDSIEDEDSTRVSFSPRVWVRVFARSKKERERIWYSSREMEKFKHEAMARIHQYCTSSELLPTGTGRVVNGPPVKLLFTHEALREDAEQVATPLSRLMDPSLTATIPMTPCSSSLLEQYEIRRILLVDPHEICLKLYAKGFSLMYPHAVIKTASSSADAMVLLEEGPGFDVILVEERLKRMGKNDIFGSGSALLCKVLEDGRFKETGCNAPLVIGVSAHLELDKERLEQHGADIVWPKPPPTMNASLRKDLLRCLLTKRGKTAQAAAIETRW